MLSILLSTFNGQLTHIFAVVQCLKALQKQNLQLHQYNRQTLQGHPYHATKHKIMSRNKPDTHTHTYIHTHSTCRHIFVWEKKLLMRRENNTERHKNKG